MAEVQRRAEKEVENEGASRFSREQNSPDDGEKVSPANAEEVLRIDEEEEEEDLVVEAEKEAAGKGKDTGENSTD